MTTLGKVFARLDALYPPALAEDWDNVGLLVGSPTDAVRGVATALEATATTIGEAARLGANLLVTHHPILFKPLSAIRFDRPAGALIADAVRGDVAIFAIHTNADWADGGLNDRLATALGLADVRPLEPRARTTRAKLVTFVPRDRAHDVSMAMFGAGAGVIGNYSCCSFQLDGTGTFFPEAGASPFSGAVGELAREDETRLEVLVDEDRLRAVVDAMIAAHPYEEVAYDVYPLRANPRRDGVARLGVFTSPAWARDLANTLRDVTGATRVVGAGALDRVVRRAVICTGAGASLIEKTARLGDAVLITGDLKYHDARHAEDLGVAVLDVGHFASEIGFARMVETALAEELRRHGIDVPVRALDVVRDPVESL
ncbi:MAG: Nif3-like dinuclear metal center hexameric protein [Deltaproteobacteria bacterium]|nr:Nif3-like dinuclear metal center hexameric protein [Deltaproteobacteria bacterium]